MELFGVKIIKYNEMNLGILLLRIMMRGMGKVEKV